MGHCSACNKEYCVVYQAEKCPVDGHGSCLECWINFFEKNPSIYRCNICEKVPLTGTDIGKLYYLCKQVKPLFDFQKYVDRYIGDMQKIEEIAVRPCEQCQLGYLQLKEVSFQCNLCHHKFCLHCGSTLDPPHICQGHLITGNCMSCGMPFHSKVENNDNVKCDLCSCKFCCHCSAMWIYDERCEHQHHELTAMTAKEELVGHMALILVYKFIQNMRNHPISIVREMKIFVWILHAESAIKSNDLSQITSTIDSHAALNVDHRSILFENLQTPRWWNTFINIYFRNASKQSFVFDMCRLLCIAINTSRSPGVQNPYLYHIYIFVKTVIIVNFFASNISILLTVYQDRLRVRRHQQLSETNNQQQITINKNEHFFLHSFSTVETIFRHIFDEIYADIHDSINTSNLRQVPINTLANIIS